MHAVYGKTNNHNKEQGWFHVNDNALQRARDQHENWIYWTCSTALAAIQKCSFESYNLWAYNCTFYVKLTRFRFTLDMARRSHVTERTKTNHIDWHPRKEKKKHMTTSWCMIKISFSRIPLWWYKTFHGVLYLQLFWHKHLCNRNFNACAGWLEKKNVVIFPFLWRHAHHSKKLCSL